MNITVVLEIIGLALVFIINAAMFVGWVLKREENHKAEDVRNHECIQFDLANARKDHSILNGRVEGLISKVEAMPSRDTLDEQMRRLEDRMETRFSGISEQLSQLIKIQIDSASRRDRRDSDY
jgi:hypothetical protein